MYVHHDVIIPAFPLCTAWLDCPLKGGEKGASHSTSWLKFEICACRHMWTSLFFIQVMSFVYCFIMLILFKNDCLISHWPYKFYLILESEIKGQLCW